MTDKEIMDILKEYDVLKEGHFLLSSGRHSEKYLQCARVTEDPILADRLADELAKKVLKYNPEVVVGPAMGGIILAYEMARTLGVRNIFAEREEGKMSFRRGFSLEPGEKVLITEDVVTTGGSVFEVIDTVRDNGGEVIGVVALVDRTGGDIDFGVPFEYLLSVEVPSFEPGECPLCKKEIPLESPGSKRLKK